MPFNGAFLHLASQCKVPCKDWGLACWPLIWAELMLGYRMASGVLAGWSALSCSCKLGAISETELTDPRL